MYRKFLMLMFFCCCLFKAKGQEHKWAFDIVNASGSSAITTQAVDDSSNVYIGGRFRGTMYIGTDTFTFAGTTTFAIFIAKYDGDGNYIWGKSITTAQNANLKEIVINSQRQILLFGFYNNGNFGSISFGSTTLSRSHAVFVAFMNSTGTFTDARDLGYGSFTSALDIALDKNDEIIVAMYLNGFGGWNIVNGSSGNGFVNVIAKFNSSATSVSWSKQYSIFDVIGINAVSVDRFNQIYFSCRVDANLSIFGTTSPSGGTSSFIVWVRPDGTIKSAINAVSEANNGATNNGISQIEAIDSSAIYIAGYSYQDSIKIGNSKIYSLSSNSSLSFNWVAQLSNFDTITWSQSMSRPSSTSTGIIRLTVNGDFLYLSTLHNTSGFSFGGFSTTSYVNSVLSKLDRLGNVLWYLPLNSVSAPIISGIGSQDLVYSGGFTGSLSLSPFTLSNSSSTSKPFLARTFDYSITRGQVRTGPYCAGDTLLVPYQKVGEFDTSNIFVAEISDENGNFVGRQRELGRIKTRGDSTIIGFLPLFQVASSGNYRIRVTSTSPVVQSYFKLDTLNLLIFSRDKADPGPDTLMCYGDTIELSTFGGTLWSWSPAYAMSDSSKRNPLIWPLKDTTYTIIISDTSGCGLADTADIRVSIRDLPVFNSQAQSDTLVCKNEKVLLKNTFSGGVNSYYISWFEQTGQKIQTNQTTLKADSIEVTPSGTTNYYAVLTDSCASLLDTVYYQVQVFDTMQVSGVFQDTLICKGQELQFSASVSHPRKDSISYAWRQNGNTTILSSDSFYKSFFSIDDIITLSINNTCNNELKSFDFDVFTHPSISNTISELSPRQYLCRGDSLLLFANPQGGNPSDILQGRWQLNGMNWTSDTLILFADSLSLNYPNTDTFTVVNIATDGCSTPDDTAYYGFRLFPSLKIDSLSGLESRLCYIQNQSLTLNISGGLGNNAYSYQWLLNTQVLDTNAIFNLSADSFTQGQNYTIKTLVKDNCSLPDSLEFNFFIPSKPEVSIIGSDTSLCSKESHIWSSTVQGGDTLNYKFLWRLNGQLVSTADTVSLYFENTKPSMDSILWLSISLSDSCSPQIAVDSIQINIAPNPAVSFKNDSLNRRQYSDTLICRGETMLFNPLGFYGSNSSTPELYRNGSLVSYTGSYSLINTQLIPEDSVLFQTISSSACGTNADTATYVVYLRQALSLDPIPDSIVCANQNVTFTANANGGLGATAYSYAWYIGNKLLNNSPSFAIEADSFIRGQFNSIQTIVNDACSLADTISFELFIPTQPLIKISGNDTSLCSGSSAFWSSNAQGGDSINYQYEWRLNGQVISNSDTVSSYFENTFPSTDSILWISVSLNDGCADEIAKDSLQITIAPYPAASFKNDSINRKQYSDTLICRGETMLFNPLGFYGSNSSTPELYRNGSLVSYTGSYSLINTQLIPEDSVLFQAISSSACGTNADTATYVVYLRQALSLDPIPDSIVCANQNVTFTANANGGLGAAAHSYTWYIGNKLLNNTPSFAIEADSFTRGQFNTIQAIANDACSLADTISIELFIPTQPIIKISGNDTSLCSGSSAFWSSNAQGGDSTNYQYEWRLNGQVISNSDTVSSYFENTSPSTDSILWISVTLNDGCADEIAKDSIQINIAPYPAVSFKNDSINRKQYSDTLICRGEEVTLYPYTFYNRFSSAPELFLNGNLVNSSSSYIFKNSQSIAADSVVFHAISGSGCGSKIDTATYVIYLRKPLSLDPIQDSLVCSNTPISFTANASGGLGMNYAYSWIDDLDGSVLGQGITLNLQDIDGTINIKLKVDDQCTLIQDSSFFKIESLDTLQIRLNSNAICADTISLTTQASGGRVNSYSYNWFVNDLPIANTQNAYTFYPDSISTLKVVFSDGCSGKNAMDSIQVAERMKFSLDNFEDSVCETFETDWSMSVQSKSSIDFNWSEYGTQDWKPLSSSISYDAANYRFSFLAENGLGCQDTFNTTLVVKPIPSASFSKNPNRLDDDNPIAEISADLNASSYLWSIDGIEFPLNQKSITYDFKDTGSYLVKLVINLNGCLDSSDQVVNIGEAFRFYDINAFSPDGDSKNETYKPYVRGDVTALDYQIFNSWGAMIFKGDLLSPAWDGTYAGEPVPQGFYLVVISISTADGQRIFKKNSLYLIR